jgi:hypothetical protein
MDKILFWLGMGLLTGVLITEVVLPLAALIYVWSNARRAMKKAKCRRPRRL